MDAGSNSLPDRSFGTSLIEAAREEGFDAATFRPLDRNDGDEIAASVKDAFGDAANAAMTGWWFSERKCPLPTSTRRFADGDGWRHLIDVAPYVSAPVWFFAQNWMRDTPPHLVFASSAEVVQAVLGNMGGFEYIVCGRELDWLFAEDHEECVSVAGADAVRRLESIRS